MIEWFYPHTLVFYCVFTSRAGITKMEKFKKGRWDLSSRTLVLVMKKCLLNRNLMGLKKLSIEIYKLLNGLSPDHLSLMFERSNNPYNVRDNNKLQPKEIDQQ